LLARSPTGESFGTGLIHDSVTDKFNNSLTKTSALIHLTHKTPARM